MQQTTLKLGTYVNDEFISSYYDVIDVPLSGREESRGICLLDINEITNSIVK